MGGQSSAQAPPECNPNASFQLLSSTCDVPPTCQPSRTTGSPLPSSSSMTAFKLCLLPATHNPSSYDPSQNPLTPALLPPRSIPASVLHLHLLHGALFTHSFIHSLIQQALMRHLSVPGIVPGTRDRKTDQTQSFLSRSSWARSYHTHSITICEPSLLSVTRHLTLWPEIALCVFPPCSVRDTCLTNTSI